MFAEDSLTDEIKHLNTVFIKNDYSTDFIERNAYIRPNDSSNNSYTTIATIPYVRGTSETIARILRTQIRVHFTTPYLLMLRAKTNLKTDQKFIRSKCSDCQARVLELVRATGPLKSPPPPAKNRPPLAILPY